MDNIAVASINSFGSTPKANVPQSEESIFVLSGSELKAIIAKAIQEATKPILTRLSDLEGTLRTQEEEIVDLRAFGEAEIERVCVDIAQDRRRLATLEESRTITTVPPGDKTTARIEQIKSILKSRGATSFGELERILKISPREMLRITKKLDLRYFEITRRPGDARQKVLRLRARIR